MSTVRCDMMDVRATRVRVCDHHGAGDHQDSPMTTGIRSGTNDPRVSGRASTGTATGVRPLRAARRHGWVATKDSNSGGPGTAIFRSRPTLDSGSQHDDVPIRVGSGRSRLRRIARRIALSVLALVAVLVVLVLVSIVGALRTSGNESFLAKWADWLRDHHAEALVLPLENWYFDREQPATGGQPNGLNSVPTFDARQNAKPSEHLRTPPDVAL